MSRIEPGAHDLDRINRVTEAVIGSAFAVHNALGFGFLEKVYENALVIEMRKRSLNVLQQHRLAVHYEGVVVGEYVADALVDGTVVLDLKAVRELDVTHVAQALNLVRATDSAIALLIRFGRRVRVKRLLHPRLLPHVQQRLGRGGAAQAPSGSSGPTSLPSVFLPDEFDEV